MIDAAPPGTTFVSVEHDEGRARAASELVAGVPDVEIVHGDWTELRAHGPFDLLVLDGGGKGKSPADGPPLDPDDDWLRIGGLIVLDDYAPLHPDDAATDPARAYWLDHGSPPSSSGSHRRWQRSWAGASASRRDVDERVGS